MVPMFQNSRRRKPKITIPTASSVDYRSESVTQRLDKIAEHYAQLEQALAAVESKLPGEPNAPAPIVTPDQPPRKPR